jgi:intraflagellar transport protein 122
MAFNSITHNLASCSSLEFGLYSLEQKSVQKFKNLYKINTCAWSTDGQTLALGCDNGNVSLRNRSGEEFANIELPDGHSIWAIVWLSSRY